jgi:hypothetical protein
LRSSNPTSAKRAFVAGSQKARPIPSEWKYEVTGPSAKIPHKTVSGFYNRKTTEPFSSLNEIGYGLDPYERKQDL